MPNNQMWRVEWEIEVEATDPRAAALKAQAMQQKREEAWVGVFSVYDEVGVMVRIDLDDLEEEEEES